MPYDPSGKRVKPRDKAELIAIEDRLAALQHQFREIRLRMKQFGMDTVELSLGTFELRLSQAEPLVQIYLGKVMAQAQVHKRKRIERAEAAADATIAEVKARKKTK